MNIRTPVFAGLMLFSTLAVATPRDGIVITSNSDFTADNGVVNPGAAGTAADPYVIEGWSIDTAGSNICVEIRNTDKHFVLRNITCQNAITGFLLANLSNGTVTENTISKLRGIEHLFFGIVSEGIRVENASNLSITGNRFEDLKGADGGGDQTLGLSGARVYGVLLWNVSSAQITGNSFTALQGGAGAPGANGPNPGDAGQAGGHGGDAAAVYVGAGSSDILIEDNTVTTVSGGAGANGGAGAFYATGRGGDGGNGGNAGFAHGVIVAEGNAITVQYNEITQLSGATAGHGGNAAGGVSYGNGGHGGQGGNAGAVRYDDSGVLNTHYNTFSDANGGNGGNGGLTNWGSVGGDGGNGGYGVGIHYSNSSNYGHVGNTFGSRSGGSAGSGGMPGGSNGTAGAATDILLN